ncbi:hypothetical protein EV421DRAFT_1734973 [Armillaria borealis]|uniref:Uncharacterized protein n=1 Tax=Armillaria borealis TaxID=47425 RepID=A0AA39JMQ2_9AGAR|nr:hypothetical protein EV421DRAFT_1734973 [Armillaria borealis]
MTSREWLGIVLVVQSVNLLPPLRSCTTASAEDMLPEGNFRLIVSFRPSLAVVGGMNGTKIGRIGSVDVTLLTLISAFVSIIPSGYCGHEDAALFEVSVSLKSVNIRCWEERRQDTTMAVETLKLEASSHQIQNLVADLIWFSS